MLEGLRFLTPEGFAWEHVCFPFERPLGWLFYAKNDSWRYGITEEFMQCTDGPIQEIAVQEAIKLALARTASVG